MQNKASKQPTVSGSTIIIPRDFHAGLPVEIPGSKRMLFPTGDDRANDKMFSIGGVMAIISGKMNHTLGIFFKDMDVVLAKFKSNLTGGYGDEILFYTPDGGTLLTVHLAGLDIYSETKSGAYVQLQRIIPGYSGRLMYNFEKDVLKGSPSNGLLAAIAIPYDNPEWNGYDVPDFFKQLIFTRHL